MKPFLFFAALLFLSSLGALIPAVQTIPSRIEAGIGDIGSHTDLARVLQQAQRAAEGK